jgi:DNA-binding CsgD family transcriptional regulator
VGAWLVIPEDHFGRLLADDDCRVPAAEAYCIQAIHRSRRENAEIRRELYLSEPTVKIHVGRILMKLGVRDRVQLVGLAYERGLVEPGRG